MRFSLSRIRTRLLLLAVVPATLAGLAVGTFLTVVRLDDLRASQGTLGRTYAAQLASAAEYGLFANNRATLATLANRLLLADDVQSVVIRDATGRDVVRVRNPRFDDRGALAALRTVLRAERDPVFRAAVTLDAASGGDLYLAEPRLDARPLGEVEVELSQHRLVAAQLDALLISIALCAVVLLVATTLALRIGASVERPLRRIADTIRRVARGDLAARVTERSRGELGALERDVNRMADAVAAARHELQQRVDQATRELRQSLEAVEINNVELDLARKRALAASRVKSEFLANMSHEIRTPMNAVVGFTALLAKTPLDGDQQDYVATIERSSRELLRLLEDVLNLSQIESGRVTLEDAEFDPRELIQHVMVRHARDAYARGLELTCDCTGRIPAVLRGDVGRLQQIVSNLVHNAVKYTERGGVVIGKRALPLGDGRVMLRITVTDSGRGIALADQPRLFEAFTQLGTDPAGRKGGVGLGLAISRKLAEALGGTLTLDSAPGQGSRFTVEVPFTVVREGGGDGLHMLDGVSVLLHERVAQHREAVRAALSEAGADVLTCERLEELGAQIATLDPDRQALVLVGVPDDVDRTLVAVADQCADHAELPRVVTLRSVDRGELRLAARRIAGIALPRYASPEALIAELRRTLEAAAGGIAPGTLLAAALSALDADLRRMVADELPAQADQLQALRDDARGRAELAHRIRGTGAFCRLAQLERLAVDVEAAVASGGAADAEADALAAHMREVARAALALATGPEALRPAPPAIRLDGLRVVVADDNAINRELLLRMLAQSGAIGVAAPSAELAIDLIAAGGFDAALLDIHMPGMSGIDAASKVRALPPPADGVLLIAVTANALPEVRDQAFAVGFDDFLVKPIDADRLVARLAQSRRPTVSGA